VKSDFPKNKPSDENLEIVTASNIITDSISESLSQPVYSIWVPSIRHNIIDIYEPNSVNSFSQICLYFPFELCQRDYIKRLFFILGNGVRSRILRTFQVLQLSINEDSRKKVGNSFIRKNTLLIPGIDYYCEKLLMELLLLRQLPFSNTADFVQIQSIYSDLFKVLRIDSKDDFLQKVEFLYSFHNKTFNSDIYFDSGQLFSLTEVFEKAEELIIMINQNYVDNSSSVSLTSEGVIAIRQLKQLQQQMNSHCAFKNERMQSFNWNFDNTISPNLACESDESTILDKQFNSEWKSPRKETKFSLEDLEGTNSLDFNNLKNRPIMNSSITKLDFTSICNKAESLCANLMLICSSLYNPILNLMLKFTLIKDILIYLKKFYLSLGLNKDSVVTVDNLYCGIDSQLQLDLSEDLAECQVESSMESKNGYSSRLNFEYVYQQLDEAQYFDNNLSNKKSIRNFINGNNLIKEVATLLQISFSLENDLRNLINSIKYDLKSEFNDQSIEEIKVTAAEDLTKKLITLRDSINCSFSRYSNISDFRKEELKSRLLNLKPGISLSNQIFDCTYISGDSDNDDSVAALTLRSKSTLLIKSIYSSWPLLSVKIPHTHCIDNILMRGEHTGSSSTEYLNRYSFQLIESFTNTIAIKKINFSDARLLRNIGFTILHLKSSRVFDLHSILCAGFSIVELKDTKSKGLLTFTVRDLRNAG
jgi:hypothetical protein